jgi:hypothetical protein
MSMREKQSGQSQPERGKARSNEGLQSTPADDMQLEDAGTQASGSASSGEKSSRKSVASSMKQQSKTQSEKGSRR